MLFKSNLIKGIKMKKVLYGLVITIMMTGSGYAGFDTRDYRDNDLTKSYCEFLKSEAFFYVKNGYDIQKEILRKLNEDIELSVNDRDRIKDNIISAHHFASVYSAFCD